MMKHTKCQLNLLNLLYQGKYYFSPIDTIICVKPLYHKIRSKTTRFRYNEQCEIFNKFCPPPLLPNITR